MLGVSWQVHAHFLRCPGCACEEGRLSAQPAVKDDKRRLSVERHLSSEHLVKNDGESVYVSPRVTALPLDLLRRNLIGRAHTLRRFSERKPCSAGVTDDAEVDQLDLIVQPNDAVLGFQVPMHYAARVDVIECGADGDRDANCSFRTSRLSYSFPPERRAVRRADPWTGQSQPPAETA
jgi:hypothetical protein